MFDQLLRWLTPRSSKRRPREARRAILRIEPLEHRCLLSTSTTFTSGTLAIAITTGDHVNIAENGPGNFTVSDRTNPTIGGQGGGPFANVHSMTVNVSATGAVVSVEGGENPTGVGLTGNFTVTDTQPHNAIEVEIFDGFSVNGAVAISNTGAGSVFQEHTSEGKVVAGMFLDPNNKSTIGSIRVTGSGTVGFDGVHTLGNVTVNLGTTANSSFVTDGETIFSLDPEILLTNFNQNPTTIGGNLAVLGGHETELYNTIVGGKVSIRQTANTGAGGRGDLVVLGNDSIAGNLNAAVASGPGATGVFVDFSRVGGSTFLSEGNGNNVIGLQTDTFLGTTTLLQENGSNHVFIDSKDQFASVQQSSGNSLASDAAYFEALAQAHLLLPDTGSTFLGGVTSTQRNGTNALYIGQDQSAATDFASASTFQAGAGSNTELDHEVGIPLTLTGY